MQPLISIIIPCYNCAGKIEKALDSIYNAPINQDQIEIICVDDFSPKQSSRDAIARYADRKNNLTLLALPDNRRQGGARNAGVEIAKGEYIMFIDQDDYFDSAALKKVVSELSSVKSDMIMWDFTFHKYGKITERQYPHNHERVCSGSEFLTTNEYTWAPWGYSYRRQFLIENNLKFVEQVPFEDIDFVSRCVATAKTIKFSAVSTIHYTVNEDSQTNIGNDTFANTDFRFQHSARVLAVADEVAANSPQAASVIRRHAYFAFQEAIKRTIQYRSVTGRYKLINTWVAGKFPDATGILGYASKYPYLFTTGLNLTAPILRYMVNYKKSKTLSEQRKSS